ncbi:MAG: hypothetical protein KF749_02960 [Bacteroidetes bacterium]|nr:hypothetical protein [Bacteroidota bacterium]MCW5896776.1 hypothetical protein [Bacteroidota bacterium]
MPTYAYRWADGTVSVCSAKNKDEAAWLFDEVGPISRKLIIRLRSPVLVTLRADIENHWVLDNEGPKLGEQLSLELEEKCYPHYNKTYWAVMEKLEERNESLDAHPELRKKIEAAIARDRKDAERKIKQTPQTPDVVLLYPKGLPGQNN